MADQFEQGQMIGEIQADVKNLAKLLEDNIKNQNEWNVKTEERVSLVEAWIQTTTGKVAVLTFIFGIIGAGVYIVVNIVIKKFIK